MSSVQFTEYHIEDVRTQRIRCNDARPGATAAYLSRYTFATFAHLCDDHPLVLRLSERDAASLKHDALICDRFSVQMQKELVHEWSVAQSVAEYLRAHPDGIFAKVADASPKDGRDLESQKHSFRALTSLEEIWEAFVSSRRVLTFLLHHDGPCDLVLRPWNPRISCHNEYRAFVFDRRLVAISQQHLYRVVNHPVSPESLVAAVQAWLCAHVLPECDTVLDVFYDDGMVHLIECNPAWYGSGASLFTWDELSRLQQRHEPVYVRWVTG